ncbi:YdcF family protein [Mycolicibacterium sp. ELW1]|uniref:YdcF family protein n=1 Tax=Mycobacteriaceae TaxID=1762 RepID=UPI0011EE1E79|nr:YdcF family protein [Mycobacterium sp. ELW1]QEN15631.1 YdcF family protein [Mycobacterium sp. ELW1]
MGRVRRALAILVAVGVSVAGILAVTGYFLFTRPHVDPLSKADAIVVLGGENDGRLEYGLNLARQGYASTVVLSNAYSATPADLGDFEHACASGTPSITVLCFIPDPFTTRGEAMYVARLAKEHNWTHVIVVSWNYHMVRARYIFHQCFGGDVTMNPVPRPYDFTPWRWAAEYVYQYAGFVKAVLLGCDAG